MKSNFSPFLLVSESLIRKKIPFSKTQKVIKNTDILLISQIQNYYQISIANILINTTVYLQIIAIVDNRLENVTLLFKNINL